MNKNVLDLPEFPHSKGGKSYMFLLFLSACAILLGFFFSNMQWFGAGILIFSGCISLILITLFKYLRRKKTNWYTLLKMSGTAIISFGIGYSKFEGLPVRILFGAGILALIALLVKFSIGLRSKIK